MTGILLLLLIIWCVRVSMIMQIWTNKNSHFKINNQIINQHIIQLIISLAEKISGNNLVINGIENLNSDQKGKSWVMMRIIFNNMEKTKNLIYLTIKLLIFLRLMIIVKINSKISLLKTKFYKNKFMMI